MTSRTETHTPIPFGLKLIGAFKLVLALLLLAAGIGVFRLRHADLGLMAQNLIEHFSFDAGNRFVSGMVESVSGVSHRKLIAIDAFTFIYSALYLVEGVGLLMRKHWAEYLVIVVTGLLIPYEAYEVLFKFSWVKAMVLAVNLAIIFYLMWALKREARAKTR